MNTPGKPSDVAFSPSVKAEQEMRGSRKQYQRMEETKGWPATVTAELGLVLAGTQSFYLATANAGGQPYIQHRGGPAGFLEVVDDKTLRFADYGGNRQYITIGNLKDNRRAFIFIMDYARQRRLKLWGTAEVVENDPDKENSDAAHPEPKRYIMFRLEAWDRNCPQFIPRLLPADGVEEIVGRLKGRILQLEEELSRLRNGA